MTWVKVCGVRRAQDLRAAEEAGADAVGFVLGPSPRRIRPEEAATLAAETGLETFLVTVDSTPADLLNLAAFTGVTGVQAHGALAAEAAEAAERAGMRVLRPVLAGPDLHLDLVPEGQIPLVDSGRNGMHGGTGKTWDRKSFTVIDRPWVMAGGLGPRNVADAINELRPWGVDASSRLESAPGVKDPDLVAAFVREAKRA